MICVLHGCSITAGPGPQGEDQGSRDPAAAWAADTAEEDLRADSIRARSEAEAVRMSGSGPVLYSACTGDPPGSSGYCTPACRCGVNLGDCDDDGECAAGLVCMRDTGGLFGWDPEVDTCMEQCSSLALGTPDFCSPACPCEHGQGDCDEDEDCASGNVCEKNVGASYGFADDVDVCVCADDPSGAACQPDEPPGLPAHEEECVDALDDDGDGDIDCADQDCAGDPACAVAPPLDRTVATAFHDSVRFLYEGPQAVQIGADPAVFDPVRVSVLRGRVLDRKGAPVSGVRVTVHGHDAYGYTETRDSGVFDLVVNGGVPVTVTYEADGFLPLQRTIDTREMRSRQYHWFPDVVLTSRDPVVTEVVPGAAELQVARGSVQDDGDGARQATLMFAPGTQATAVLPDGSEVALSTMHVRATEYTVGERGPEAMPGTLPPTTSYTYAVELSVDEADAMGARSVEFDRPVGFYLENFLDFPVGTIVPLGYYDRDRAAWIAADSGVVLGVVAHSGGLAAIDLDGDGAAENDAVLAAAGITTEERARLVALYEPGQTLWRVSIPHFTPWDCNLVNIPPLDAIFPDRDLVRDPDRDQPCPRSGSVIQCERQSLSEFVDVPGTHVTLAYHGDRKPGWDADRDFEIEIPDAELPASMTGIVLEAEIAGQRMTQELAPSPDQRPTVSWDGRDGYGRIMQGVQHARVRLGYSYQPVYAEQWRFGGWGRGPITNSIGRNLLTLWSESTVMLGNWDATAQGLGGFGIASHHGYDPESGTLFLGDGTRRSARNVAPVLTRLDDAPLPGVPTSITEAADGTVYVGTASGDIYHVPPTGQPGIYARVSSAINDLVAAPDGTLYVTDVGRRRIITVDSDRNIRVVAGGGQDPFLDSDGAARLATEVALSVPTGLALTPDGGLYIMDHGSHRVLRYMDPSGMLTTIRLEGLHSPWSIELGPDGSLYIAPFHFGGSGLYRMHPDGRIEAVIGADADMAFSGVSVRADGTVLVTHRNGNRVLRVNEDGTFTPLAGGGSRALAAGEMSTDVAIPVLYVSAIDTEGKILFTDGVGIYRVDSSVPGVSGTDIVVPSKDGSQLYVFDQAGRHLETRDALTNVTLLAFEYDDAGRVIRMTDRDGLATHIERDATGLARAIEGPYGQRTALFYDQQDQLVRVEDPLQRQVSFEYDQAGRMVSLRDARDGLHTFEYDPRGRLVRDVGPTGYTQTLAPADDSANGGNVMVTTSLSRSTRYQVQSGSNDVSVRSMELAWGGLGTVTKYPTRTELAAPDGTSTNVKVGSDPRWHTQAPWAREARVVTPMGRTFVTTSEREVGIADPAQPHRITSMLQRYTVAGRTSTVHYDAETRTTTGQSPSGRQRTVTRDERGRVVRIDQAGTAPYIVAYDDHGRAASIQRGEGAGARVTQLHYDANGNLAQRIDPLGRPHHYEHDVVGRLRAQVGPDGQRTELDYDAHDNITRVTPPGRPAHELRYTGADQAERYIPPALDGVDAEVVFHYDADLAPIGADGPGGQQIEFQHDHAGRIQFVLVARGYYGHAYDPATGHLVQLTSPDSVGLRYERDGALLRETRWSIPGAADVTVGLDYDEAFRPRALAVQDTPPIEHGYDADDALIQAGPLAIVRDPQTGLPDVTQAGSLETDLDVSPFGEPEHFSASFAGQPLYQVAYERDALGRITRVDEIIAGQSRSLTYGYDDADRLASVDELGQPGRALLYDPNGNLVEVREDGVTVLTATHDAQDRVLTHGRFALTHSDSGHLASKLDTLSGQSTAYHYDELGNLLGVDLADGRSIQYLIDGADRRVARLMDGALQWLFVYAGSVPVARLHPDGSVESIYVYGALAHVPDLVLKAGSAYRIVHDHLGSPRLVVDIQTGDIVQRLDYDVHGRVLGDSNPGFQPFGFAGGLHDVDTGLLRFGARDYDPELARWTAKDPSGFAGRDTNLYAYAYGDPMNFVDPNGELAFLVPLIIAIGKGALASAATDAGIELASQLIENGGDIGCVDWGNIGSSGLDGAMSGGVTGPLGKAFTTAKKFAKGKRRFSAKDRADGFERSKDASGVPRCEYCGKELDPGAGKPNSYEADHRTPHSRGGSTDADNLAPSCRSCNRSKGAKTPSEWQGS